MCRWMELAIIKVEEYKRPTFDVVFTPYEDTYNMGDSIVVKGEAKTFAGAPVRMAKVNIRYPVRNICGSVWEV